MPALDLLDEVFVAAAPATVAAFIAEPARWPRWWPGLDLTVEEDRGAEGLRWLVAGTWRGSAEVWLERHLDGVIAHFYLRLDSGGALTERGLRRARRDWTRRAKRVLWEIKDEVEGDRRAGEPPRT